MDLWLPGPTSVPEGVRDTLSNEVVGHRTPEFSSAVESVTKKAKTILETDNDLFFLTSSGTGAMQAAVSNFFSSGDLILVCSLGAFGERFARILKEYELDVAKYSVQWGEALSPARLDRILEESPFVEAVFVTHNETSTGVTNDLEAIGRICKKHGKFLVVDSISGAGALPVKVDKWGVDVLVTGVQKGWMTPPGLSIITVSERAWSRYEQSRISEFYFDLGKAKDKYRDARQTPWTPAVSILLALDRATDKMLEEGMGEVFARHRRVAGVMRQGLRQLGFRLVADEAHASDVVTAVFVPEGMDAEEIRSGLREEYDIRIAGGKGKFAGKALRIGHMGDVDIASANRFLSCMDTVMKKVN